MHTLVAHDDAVAHADGRYHHRSTTGRVDTCLHRLRNFVQMHMPRNDVTLSGHHRDQRPSHLLFRQPQRIQQRSVRRAVNAFLDLITYHCDFHLSMYVYLFSCQTSRA